MAKNRKLLVSKFREVLGSASERAFNFA